MAPLRVTLFALPFVAFPGAFSQSVKSCGGPNDHLKNPVIKLTPDPPTQGGTLTIEASGTLDEAMTAANSRVDLHVQALGVVKANVNGSVPMSISPGAAAGPFSLKVGPFQLPSNIPGYAVVQGQVHVTNDKNEPILCIDMDLNVPGMAGEVAAVPQLEAPETVSSCGKSTDHIPDFQLTSSGGVMTMTGTLDEAVTTASIDLDVKLKVLIISLPLKMTIPLAVSPGAPKGAIKASIGPSSVVLSPDVKATITGTMKVNDGNGEEITCLNVDTVVSGKAASILPGEHDWSSYTYEQYVVDFKKNGENSASVDRKAIFNANLRLILEHNANPDKTWHAGANEFTDWTNEEFRAFRTGSRPDLKALRLGSEHVSVTGAIPEELDWREKGQVVTPVKNQGGCGSCWAFSATETFESHYAIATGEAAPVLSPQQIVSCSPNPDHCGGTGGCQGSTQPLAFNYTESAGLTTEQNYPYQGATGTCQTSKIKAIAKNSGYVQLPTNNYTDLINAVATKGPIAISVAAGGIGWQLYFGGIMSGSNNYDMDHAVQLVGYGTENGKDYWLVRNSWGGWGEKGYIRLQRFGEGKEPCGTDSTPQDGDACAGDTKPRTYCGECGVLSSSSYPTGITKASSVVQI